LLFTFRYAFTEVDVGHVLPAGLGPSIHAEGGGCELDGCGVVRRLDVP
jgi:hypothetical protein